MFFHKKSRAVKQYDWNRTEQIPVLRSSICTGEQVVGFRHKTTGEFQEVTCIKSEKELEEFLKSYDIPREALKKEW